MAVFAPAEYAKLANVGSVTDAGFVYLVQIMGAALIVGGFGSFCALRTNSKAQVSFVAATHALWMTLVAVVSWSHVCGCMAAASTPPPPADLAAFAKLNAYSSTLFALGFAKYALF